MGRPTTGRESASQPQPVGPTGEAMVWGMTPPTEWPPPGSDAETILAIFEVREIPWEYHDDETDPQIEQAHDWVLVHAAASHGQTNGYEPMMVFTEDGTLAGFGAWF